MGDGMCREGSYYADLREEINRTPMRVIAEEVPDPPDSSSAQVSDAGAKRAMEDLTSRVESLELGMSMDRAYNENKFQKFKREAYLMRWLVGIAGFLAIFW